MSWTCPEIARPGSRRARPTLLCLCWTVSSALVGCERAGPGDPLHDLALAPGADAGAASPDLPRAWVTPRGVVVAGARLPTSAEVKRALEPARRGGPFALGVDRGRPFEAAWSVVAAAGPREPLPVELLVGERSSPRAIRVCAGPRPRPRGTDCWGRAYGRPGSGARRPQADAGPAGDDRMAAPATDLSLPMTLTLLVGRQAVSIRVQERLVRVIETNGEAASAARLVSETLGSLRLRNDWDRLAIVRVDPAIPWGDVIAVLGTLGDQGFDQIRIESAGGTSAS